MRVSLLVGFAALLASPAFASASETTSANLSHKAYSKFSLVLPNQAWKRLDGKIEVAHDLGDGFRAYVEGVVLMVDTDGDGKAESKVKGLGGFMKLHGKTRGGKSFTYGVRFEKRGKVYYYAASGAMVGKLDGMTVQLIDMNGNGRYNDVGKDAMIVGSGKGAAYLSKVVNLRNELFNLEVSEDGTSVTATPYEGAAGFLDIRGGFKSKGKLVSAVLNDAKGELSFNITQVKGAMKVPAASYTFVGGLVAKGKEQARIHAGRMTPLSVATGQTLKLNWGGKVTAEFSYSHANGKVTIPPKANYYGTAGEEYVEWVPDQKSPKFLIYESGKKRPIASGRWAMC
ncbi:MAG: hypothetical protein CMJ85_02445 [Planctomycetes bacterium]|jgi:hypothetical protein|nr:hypothetical protein [Planctomycetota bacterium]